MMNKYTHHLSVAFVVSLEKFPIIGHKKNLPEIRFPIRTGGGHFTGCLYVNSYCLENINREVCPFVKNIFE